MIYSQATRHAVVHFSLPMIVAFGVNDDSATQSLAEALNSWFDLLLSSPHQLLQ